MATEVDRLAEFVDLARSRARAPISVGIDGRSGSGKSTLAAALADRLDWSNLVIEGDEFYGGGSAATWDRRTVEERVDAVIDWRAQFRVLDSLRSTGRATWRSFDWEAPDWDSETPPRLAIETVAEAADVVVLEGAYSCRPELHEVLDLRVLLATPDQERRRRLSEREGDDYRDDWEGRWSSAEDHYFGQVMPAERFDLVLGSG